VSDATIRSITLETSIMLLEVSFALLDPSFMMFIVQASLAFVTYNHNMFIAQATGLQQG
jgi:hypothetical protein